MKKVLGSSDVHVSAWCGRSLTLDKIQGAKCEPSTTPLLNGKIPARRNEDHKFVIERACLSLACKDEDIVSGDFCREIFEEKFMIFGIVHFFK